jgi:3-phenylpropionate/trans-cinnamate dioxygenase ferredoxin reductase subunit
VAAERVVIVGASLAGATAAATLRDEGFDGDIVLVGAEPDLPYERPPLSKKYLRGLQPFEKGLVRPEAFYAEHEIELLLGVAAVRLDPVAHTVELADGRQLRYEKALLATGGRNRRPPIPGLELDGVHDLRTRADADAIRAEMAPGRRAVVVGLGFIGSEVAASLRESGLEVVAVERFATPLEPVLGPDVGRVLAELHEEHGVRCVLGDGVAAFEGRERVEAVVTESGSRFECDFAVVGLGLQPSVELAAGAGLEVGNGIHVDPLCRTSAPDVFAAGDVAAHEHPVFGRRVRVEHWLNAIEQGAAAARSMLGRGQAYEEVHWFWSDQYDANLQYAGHHDSWDELVIRGSLEERRFVGFYVEGGRVRAAVALNRARDLRRAMGLVRAQAEVDPALLRDEDTDLRTLAGVASGEGAGGG